jgi:hypothetical protein
MSACANARAAFTRHISTLPAEQQARVIYAKERIREVLEEAGEHGLYAFALVATELAAEEEARG